MSGHEPHTIDELAGRKKRGPWWLVVGGWWFVKGNARERGSRASPNHES
jgi:hypothetical protein